MLFRILSFIQNITLSSTPIRLVSMPILSYGVWSVYHRIRLKINRYGNWTRKGKPLPMIQLRESFNLTMHQGIPVCAEANWKDYLHQASSRRLLDYAKGVIARLSHQPICKHEDPCDILCEVDRTVRCIKVFQQ